MRVLLGATLGGVAGLVAAYAVYFALPIDFSVPLLPESAISISSRDAAFWYTLLIGVALGGWTGFRKRKPVR